MQSAEDPAAARLFAAHHQGILAVVKRDGHPHMSNVFYAWDAEERVARISTSARRVKARVLRRHPCAALHVSGSHFWAYAVGEGRASLSAVIAARDDPVARELLRVYEAIPGFEDRNALLDRLVNEERLVIRLAVERIYGLVLEEPRRATG